MTSAIETFIDPKKVTQVPSMFFPSKGDPRPQVLGKGFLLVLLVVALTGGLSVLVALQGGHHVMGTTSEVPWGVLIATYVFFVAMTSGLCLVSSLGHVFGFETFQPIAKRAVFLALVTLVVGFSVIGSELERPFLLAWLAISSPNPKSPIWWMGALYGLYTAILAIELYFLFRNDHHRARNVGIVAFVASLLAHSNLGAVFGLSHSRPYWEGPFFPLYFLSLALVSGAGLLMLMVYLEDYFVHGRLRDENTALFEALRKLLALFLGVSIFMTLWRLIAGVHDLDLHRSTVTMASLTGPLFFSFWLFEVFLGVVVPLALLLGPRGKNPGTAAIAAFLPILGIFVMRYNFVLSGQMLSLKPVVGPLGEHMIYQPPFKGATTGFLSYTPSLVEVLVVAGACAAATLLYVGGRRVLRPLQEV